MNSTTRAHASATSSRDHGPSPERVNYLNSVAGPISTLLGGVTAPFETSFPLSR